ncbi:uncharacterized protein PHACADRAFT_255665 [Phanerochaete carnosa HHB-10118-sp]|uniref:Uncharacterized protein n=1 Tax=Phanerochaete carnosa (strain HHB-10118-sp) TaxID=650164 RepID=K5WXJ8_PHACS|nr:uncharacterized protein PHACADRAFT_255665 [Phanerochaete carnosa HHB-10118-sp]EKM55212.1 hypothetical protein PHACADRAFT_255665 [Phanerochaete carnosa HHB-10118-sp]
MCPIEALSNFEFFRPDCECNPVDSQDRDTLKDYYTEPERAMYQACGCNGESADVTMLHTITTCVVQNTGDRNKRLAKHLIEAILEGYILPIENRVNDEDAAFRLQRCY